MALKYYDSYGNFMSNNIPVELQHVQCSNIHPLPRSIDIILNVTSCHLNGRRHPLCKPALLSKKQLKDNRKISKKPKMHTSDRDHEELLTHPLISSSNSGGRSRLTLLMNMPYKSSAGPSARTTIICQCQIENMGAPTLHIRT